MKELTLSLTTALEDAKDLPGSVALSFEASKTDT